MYGIIETCVDSFLTCVSPLTTFTDRMIEPVIQPLHGMNSILASVLSMKNEQSLYLTTKLFSLGIALLYRLCIPTSKRFYYVKYLFNLLAGFFVVSALYKSQVFILVAFALLAYLLMNVLPRSINRIVTPVTFFSLSFMLTVYDQIKYPGVLRYSFYIAGMQFALRISSLTYCLYDGLIVFSGETDLDDIPRRVKALAVKKIPPPLKFMSYVFFHGSVLTNPPFEYKVYEDSIEDEEQKKMGVDWIAMLHRIKWIAIYMTLITVGQNRFGWKDDMIKKKYTEHMTVFEMWYQSVFAFSFITWKLILNGMFGELVCITSGIGYLKDWSKEKGEYQWEYIKCSDPWALETSVSVRTKIKTWNITVEKWFRYYFYFRLPFSKFINRMLTGMFAAAWHGSYSGIFLLYACAIGTSQIYVIVYKKFGDFIQKNKSSWAWYLVTLVVTSVYIRWMCGSLFFCQTWDEVVAYHSRMYYALFWFIGLMLVFVSLLPNYSKKRKEVGKED